MHLHFQILILWVQLLRLGKRKLPGSKKQKAVPKDSPLLYDIL